MRQLSLIDRLHTALALLAALLWGLVEWAALSRTRWMSRGR